MADRLGIAAPPSRKHGIRKMNVSALMRDFPLDHRLTREEAVGLVRVDDIDAAACRRRAPARCRARAARLLFAKSLHSAHPALPRRLPLLHLRARAAVGRKPLSLARPGACDCAKPAQGAGCKEALFTLGDKPELRYRAAREELDRLGHPTTLSYLAEAAASACSRRNRTAAAPQSRRDDAARTSTLCARSRCRRASCWRASPSASARRAAPHFGSPDKAPAARLETHAARRRAQRAVHVRAS